MKYINFKRYKFSTIVKKLNTILLNLNSFLRVLINGYLYPILKSIIKSLRHNFLKIFKFISYERNSLKKIYRYLDKKRFNFRNITKYADPEAYIYHIKKIKLIGYKFLYLHLPLAIVFFGLLYLVIPTFYNYDQSTIEKIICDNQSIKCVIRGKVNYSFYPTPRIKIKDLIINDFLKKQKTLITIENAVIKLSIKNLLAKEKHKFKKIIINNFEVNIDMKNANKYKNIFEKQINLIPTIFKKGDIIMFDGKDYVATINEANIVLQIEQGNVDASLKGKFLSDYLKVDLSSKKAENKKVTDIMVKMSNMNFLAKIKLFNEENNEDTINGNFLVKNGKNKITGIFEYKNNQFIVKKSNLRNTFLDGRLEGKIVFLPYFNFDLDLNLNSINFTKMYNYFLSLDKRKQKDFFTINKKINGKLNLSSDKIYSSYNLVKSLESRIKFNNGSISIEQLLLNLGKLGASDLLGVFNNDKKHTNFRFESNIFVDNQKKFLSKFGIYDKEDFPSNIFVSGNFDLENLRTSFYEISDDEKLANDDINFIEKEFNYFMLENGFESLFLFPKFKEFVKSVNGDVN